MNTTVEIRKLETIETALIHEISEWYVEEWNVPAKETYSRLAQQEENGVLFQLVAFKKGQLVGTGGLSTKVNLLKVYPKYAKYTPWVALLQTDTDVRGMGIGTQVLKAIEAHARKIGLDTIYLYTFTAEDLYKRCGWVGIERMRYKGHDAVLMKKNLEN